MRFKTVKLGELLDVLTDYHANGAYKKLKENVELLDEPDYAVMIRTTNFEQNDFASNLKYITEHAYNFLAKSKVYAGDIIMNKIANAGSSYLMPELDKPVSLAMNLFLLRINTEKANPTYVYIYLKIHEAYVKNFANGSVTKTITKEAVKNLEIQLPERSVQDSIVKIYFSLSDKIQLNQKTNQILEQMAQAIFKSWFVDFEPVKAKMAALEAGGSEDDALLAAMQAIAGNALFASNAADADAATQLARLQAEHPEQYATLRATAELFPAAMQDSELGEIPEGWSVNKIEDLIQRISVGKRYSQKTVFESGSIPVLDQGKSGIIGYHNDEPGLKASEDDPVIVFANHTCYMRLVMHDFSAIQNVLPFKGKELNIYWIYLATLGKEKFTEYKGHWPDFVIKEVVTPNDIIASHFGSIVKNLFITQFHNEQQSASLSNIRDTLLPKLLSGELSVSDAAGQIPKAEEAVNVQS